MVRVSIIVSIMFIRREIIPRNNLGESMDKC